MKHLKTQSGPFVERPFFREGEIEDICERELVAVQLYPDDPSPIRIDRFVEKRFGVHADYQELPEGVLGLTRFSSGGVSELVVSKTLDSEGTLVAQRRIRTTLAHEAGHALFHTHLFVLSPRRLLFGDSSDPDQPKVLCREGADGSRQIRYDGHWWEFQANCAIGGLLLPSRLLREALTPYMRPAGTLGLMEFDATCLDSAICSVADIFDVNPVVARIRIRQLYPEGTGQMRL